MSLRVYKSSAGSGKTTALVIQYLALALKNPDQFKQIIALTFTVKATNEMKTRVINFLVQLKNIDLTNPDKKTDYILKDLQQETNLNAGNIKERAAILLENILHKYGEFGFSTIDSFVIRIVRSFSHDLNLSSNFDIELDKDPIIDIAIQNIYEQIGKNKILTDFLVDFTISELENENSTNLDIPLKKLGALIFDSKHYNHIDKIKNISIENFVEIKKILNREIKSHEKKIKILGEQISKTIEKYGLEPSDTSYKWLDLYCKKLCSNNEHCYDLEKLENKNFIGCIEDNKDWYTKNAKPDVRSRVDSAKPELMNLISETRSYLKHQTPIYIAQQMILSKITPLALIHELKNAIQEYSDENNVIHISEANRKISEVIANQHAPFIYERIGQRFNNYLIDEFQDTSVIQWNNILPLIENSLASGNRNLLVGDAKQSIYRWRDGDVEQFVNLPKLSNNGNLSLDKLRQNIISESYEESTLNTNYRSLENIIIFNNHFFSILVNIAPEYVKKFFQHYEQISNDKSKKGLISLNYLDDAEKTEYLFAIKNQIIKLTTEQNYKLSDICIICRKNAELSTIADFLITENIDIVSSDALFLYKSKIVNLIISFLKIIIGENIPNNCYNILRFILKTEPEDTVLFSKANTFFNYLNKYDYHFDEKEMEKMELYELTEYIINKSKIIAPTNPFLFKFMDLILEESKKHGANIRQFLENWEEKREKIKIETSEDTDAVKLLTIHKSKGLEFPIVLFPVMGIDSNKHSDNIWEKAEKSIEHLIPEVLIETIQKGKQSIYSESILLEDDRKYLDKINTLYVACTRAEKQLHMYFTKDDKKIWETVKTMNFENSLEIIKIEENTLILGKAEINKEKIIKKNNDIVINKYIYNNWNKKIRLKKDTETNYSRTNKIEKGIQLHSLLQNLTTNSNISSLIKNAINNKTISVENEIEFKEIIQNLIKNPTTATFFDANNLQICEREIITPNGAIIRPDKVIIKTDKIQIVDYKYIDYDKILDQEKQNNISQVNKYIDQISKIYNLPTEGYLLYLANEIALIPVS